jgi:hypothetical protein
MLNMKHIEEFDAFINEALKISQIRDYIKMWDENGGRERYKEWFDDKYRTYLDLSGAKTDTYTQVEEVLEDNGFYIVDYYKNVAKKLDKEDKNPFKIGKLLNRFASAELQAAYANDKDKEVVEDSEYKVVISRHPYDVVGMSTDRKWHSCMNLVGGTNVEYIEHDVKEGSIVAYLVHKSDLNINRPINRLLIKPFQRDGEVKLAADAKIYKAPYDKEINGFRATVEKWLDEKQGKIEGVYKLKPKLYVDGKSITVNPRVIKLLNKKYDSVAVFDNIYSIVRLGAAYGIVDVDGNEVLPLEYSDIYCYGANNDIENTFYQLTKQLSDGKKEIVYFKVIDGTLSEKFSRSIRMDGHTVAVAKGSLLGIMDLRQNFKLIHDYEFEDVMDFDHIETLVSIHNFDRVFLALKDDMFGVIDVAGRTLIPFEYDDIYIERFDNYYFMVESDGDYGLYDRKYEMVIPTEYSSGYIRNFFDKLIKKV